jgi:Pro-kumamolisin, activation domain/Bacterial Ig-like domain (group 3)
MMRISRRLCWTALSVVLVSVVGVPRALGQKAAVASRVVKEVDDRVVTTLKGNVHPLTRVHTDIGAVPDSQPMQRMLLLLQRSTMQELALQQLLDAQQTKSSPNFHAWLTPEQFGAQFGPSDADVQVVTDWLTRQGFAVSKVVAGRTVVEFNGTVGQVKNAFHTEIHRFTANGEEHFANVNDPAIPEALAPVVAGVVALHNFPKEKQVRPLGTFRRNKATGEVTPLFTFTGGTSCGSTTAPCFAVGPGDFNVIYNVPAGADGSGQSIAVVGQSNIDIADVQKFRSLFNLPANDPQIIVNGPDPGLLGPSSTNDEGESILDVEWAGAIAPKATIYFVTSQSTQSNPNQVSAGIDLSALYIVDSNLAGVMSESYGSCEAGLGAVGNQFYNTLWQQAAAQGITVVISSGDNGSAGCDPNGKVNANAASQGLAVSGLSSTIYNVSVGGTDFDSSTTAANTTYWNTTTGTVTSALKYMPETTWDDSTCAINFPTACNSVDPNGFDVVAGSGGASNCATGSGTSCTGYAKPSYQVGITPGTTGLTTRLQPDVSFFSSNGQNNVSFVVCEADANPNGVSCDLNSPYNDFTLVGGTSAATPTFAGIMALINQKTGQRQGNANYVLYGLAAKDSNYTSGKCNASVGNTPMSTCVFNDVTKGNNSVACVAGSPNCSNSTASGFGVEIFQNANTAAYAAVPGYDLATGLGSINVTNLLNSWSSFSRTATTTTLSNASGATSVSGQNFSVKISVVPSAAAGDVSLIATTPTGTAGFGPFTLSGGAVTATTNLLPPGTTQVVGYYAGDATHAASTSAPLAVAVSGANMASTTTLSFVTYDSSNHPVLNSSGNVAYGSPYILQVTVKGGSDCATGLTGSGTTPSIPCPTGTVAFFNGGNPLNDFPNAGTANATNVAKLNNLGIAEDQPIQLVPGNYSITAAYTSGDSNYQSSNSNTLSVTITKAATTAALASSLSSFVKGTMVTLTVTISSGSNSLQGPTGTVQFTNGSANLGAAVTCTPKSANPNTNAGASCTATLTTAISALYPPPQGKPGTPTIPWRPLAILALGMVLCVAGMRWMPKRRRHVYAYAGLLAFALLAVTIAGCGGGSSGGGGSNTRTIGASYTGDSNYAASTATTTVTVQ